MCSPGLVLVGLLLGGMEGSFLSGDFAGFTVVNTLDEPVVVVGVDRDRSHQMDLRSRIPLDAVDSTDGRFLLAPEASQTVRAADVDPAKLCDCSSTTCAATRRMPRDCGTCRTGR